MKNNESLKDTPKMSAYTKRCMMDSSGTFKPIFEKLWDQAETLVDFKELLKNDPETRMERATALLFREQPLSEELWEFRRILLGDQSFRTESDAGSLKIGNDSFTVLIPNGFGDGSMSCAIMESGELNRDAFEFFTSIEGAFNIYDYDCGDGIVKSISGRFGIYTGNGFVVFERWLS